MVPAGSRRKFLEIPFILGLAIYISSSSAPSVPCVQLTQPYIAGMQTFACGVLQEALQAKQLGGLNEQSGCLQIMIPTANQLSEMGPPTPAHRPPEWAAQWQCEPMGRHKADGASGIGQFTPKLVLVFITRAMELWISPCTARISAWWKQRLFRNCMH